jgi:lipid II:glycine glycyltransferase (peptidoglycan interpeptide bridge formation enzyme)
MLAKANNITYIKLDFDYHFTNLLDIKDNNQLLKFVSTHTTSKVVVSNKTIQYLSTALLDCSTLQYSDTIDDLMNINTSFWSKTNENIRRYTRKSLKQDWKIETGNTKDNFENFWSVYQSTANRQKFAIHPKSYFEKMLEHEFVRLIILKDSEGTPHSVWFGVEIDDTLYYLYGGNDDYSFDHYGQYLIHLVATQIAAQEKVKSYDLGGYDSSKGFGKFKEGYRGNIVTFLGPVDIILDPFYYHLIQTGIHALKRLK